MRGNVEPRGWYIRGMELGVLLLAVLLCAQSEMGRCGSEAPLL